MKQHLTHTVIAKCISKEVANFQCVSPIGKCQDLSIRESVATQNTGLWPVCTEDRHHHLLYWQNVLWRQALCWFRLAAPQLGSPHQAKQQLVCIYNHTPGHHPRDKVCALGQGTQGTFSRDSQLVHSKVSLLPATEYHGLHSAYFTPQKHLETFCCDEIIVLSQVEKYQPYYLHETDPRDLDKILRIK